MADIMVHGVIVAHHFKYAGTTGKIGETEVYFKDGTTLRLDGHYKLQYGVTYNITYNDGALPPVEPTAIKVVAG